MNFPGLVLFIVLLVAVELTVFSWASHEKPENSKDDDLNANDRSQQKGHGRMLPATPPDIMYGKKCLKRFSVNGKPPKFPSGNTVAICQSYPQSTVKPEFATLFDENLGIPRYSIYSVDPEKVNVLNGNKQFPRPKNPKWRRTAGITLQGSNRMYYKQPGSPKYHKGHVAPFHILSYSAKSGLASFTFTNAVPQVDQYNIGTWKTYEGRIVKYAIEKCAPQGGTLYLITGISEIRFSVAGFPATVQATRQVMSQSFPSHVPKVTNKIAIPNSMWTVGCCVKAGQALGALAVIGNNLPEPNVWMQTDLGVRKVQEFIRDGANDQTIELFPGNAGCYVPANQYDLDDLF